MSDSADEAARLRLREICTDLKKLLGLVPAFLPVIGRRSRPPTLSDYERRIIVDGFMSRISLPSEEWETLVRAFPSHPFEIKLLARSIEDIHRRYDYEDEQRQEEINA